MMRLANAAPSARLGRRVCIAFAAIALAGCQVQPEGRGEALLPTAAKGPLFHDACFGAPGYRGFRTELEQVVQSKDGAALRSLFHPAGRMRVNGIGGNPTSVDWGFTRPAAHSVWTELEEILALGCVPQGERLVLPAMAALTEDPQTSTDHLVALRPVDLKSAPDPASATVRTIAAGELVTFVYRGEAGGWSKLLVDGDEVFAPDESFRSPYSFYLLLDQHEGQWRILEFTGGV